MNSLDIRPLLTAGNYHNALQQDSVVRLTEISGSETRSRVVAFAGNVSAIFILPGKESPCKLRHPPTAIRVKRGSIPSQLRDQPGAVSAL